MLRELRDEYRIVVLPRGEAQARHYREGDFAGIEVPPKSLALTDVMADCALFLGAGGTMTREAAVLGIPTISIYQGELLQVDRFLIEQGFMVHETAPTAALVRAQLASAQAAGPRTALLERGREAYGMIRGAIELLGRGRGAAAR